MKRDKVSITTLGCKSNQCDSFFIQDFLQRRGFELVKKGEPANLCIINTCTVTGKSDFQSRQEVRRAIRNNPRSRIVVTGCYAVSGSDEIKKLGNQIEIVPPGMLLNFLNSLEKESGKDFFFSSVESQWSTIHFVDQFFNRTRAFFKIQDGCNLKCSYCIVPLVRGKSRSLPVSEVLSGLKRYRDSGYKEVVLTGVHLGSYGQDLEPKVNFATLLRIIAREINGIRVRVSSLDPNEISDEIVEIISETPIFCRHFHIPLQSGDNSILKKMLRNYTSEKFNLVVRKIKDRIPEVGIGVDVIAGFPGEGDEEFRNTVKLIQELPVSYLHVFPFSVRKGTAAEKLSGRVDGRVIRRRVRELIELSKTKRMEHYSSFIGRTVDVVLEREKELGFFKGFSDNYIPILIKDYDIRPGDLLRVRISKIIGLSVYGERVKGV